MRRLVGARFVAMGICVAMLAVSGLALAEDCPGQPGKVCTPPKDAKAGDPKPAADPMSPVGLWKTIDDKDNQGRSFVKIWEVNGVVYGKITKIIRRPNDPQEMKCDKCEGSLKDSPVEGLRILWNLKKDGSEYSGGFILDPEDGKTYKCFIEVQDGGKKLKVRGFIGVAALGRTQYWYRVE